MLPQKKSLAKICQKVTQFFENKIFCYKFLNLRIDLKATKFWFFSEKVMSIGYIFKSFLKESRQLNQHTIRDVVHPSFIKRLEKKKRLQTLQKGMDGVSTKHV
jgi:hypothetical protein